MCTFDFANEIYRLRSFFGLLFGAGRGVGSKKQFFIMIAVIELHPKDV